MCSFINYRKSNFFKEFKIYIKPTGAFVSHRFYKSCDCLLALGLRSINQSDQNSSFEFSKTYPLKGIFLGTVLSHIGPKTDKTIF